MRMRLFPGLSFTGLLVLSGAAVLGFAPAHGQDHNVGSIEGTWINEVKIVTCPPAPHAVLAVLQSMTTYIRGGVLVEGGGPATPPPAVSRSSGHGIWEHTGNRAFRIQFRAHSFDNLGRLVRISEVTSFPHLVNGDNPATPDVVEPYYLSGDGTNRITNINAVDGSVISVTEGCNEATSRPVLFGD